MGDSTNNTITGANSAQTSSAASAVAKQFAGKKVLVKYADTLARNNRLGVSIANDTLARAGQRQTVAWFNTQLMTMALY